MENGPPDDVNKRQTAWLALVVIVLPWLVYGVKQTSLVLSNKKNTIPLYCQVTNAPGICRGAERTHLHTHTSHSKKKKKIGTTVKAFKTNVLCVNQHPACVVKALSVSVKTAIKCGHKKTKHPPRGYINSYSNADHNAKNAFGGRSFKKEKKNRYNSKSI